MKTMKFCLLALILSVFTGPARAQEYKIPVQNTKDNKLILKNFSGDLPVEGYSGNEIVITSSSLDLEQPERAKGLKPVYPGGTDNTGIGLDVQKKDGQILVSCLLPFTRHGEYRIKVPDNLALDMQSGCENSTDITITDMKNEIEIQNCHNITLENVTGPLVLSTISGNIDIVCNEIAANAPFSINSVSGDIDISIPGDAAVNLEMRTVTGGFYSDFDFPEPDKEMKRLGGNQFSYKLNGGGSKLSLVTVSSNIYLRKK
jgi:lia operon protein LiaG